MSMPTIPNLTPDVQIDRDDAINIILASIGMEELSLSHIVNAEAEKVQYALGTLQIGVDDNGDPVYSQSLDPEQVIAMNQSAAKVLRDAIKNQMLLGMKMEDIISVVELNAITTTTTTPAP